MDKLALRKKDEELHKLGLRVRKARHEVRVVDVMGETKRQTTKVKSELPRSGVR